MKPVRPLLLALAAVVLPCCLPPADDVGSGDRIAQVTVRASITIDRAEPNEAARRPSLSPDGMLVLFDSLSTSLVPGDGNGLNDVFLRSRVDGSISNLTVFNVPPSTFPQVAPDDCIDAQLSANGRYVVFASHGDYGGASPGGLAYSIPAGTLTWRAVWRLDRQTGHIQRAFRSAAQPNHHMDSPCISASGRYIAFSSAATNMDVAPAGMTDPQIFAMDMDSNVMTLVSRDRFNAALPANDPCNDPSISDDGQTISFHSSATNLHADWTAGFRLHVYVGSASGGLAQLVSRVSSPGVAVANGFSGLADLSSNGEWIVFYTEATNLVGAGGPFVVRRHLPSGQVDLVTDQAAERILDGVALLNSFSSSISTDGEKVAFIARSDSLAGQPLNQFANVFVRTMSTGEIVLASRHLDGRASDEECGDPVISDDGRWVAWHTASPNMVDGDTNGIPDVFLRGPYR